MVLLPAASFFELLMLMMVSIVALMVFRWLVHSLVGWIPFIGNRAAAAADAVATFVQNKVENWLEPQLHSLLNWIATFAARVLDYPRAAWDALGHVDEALQHLVETKIGQLIAAATKQLHLDVTWLLHAMSTAQDTLADVPSLIEHRLHAYGDALAHTLTDQFTHGIDRLKRDVIEPGINEAEHVAGHALDVATGVRGDLRDLARRLDIPVSALEALIAAVGVTAAVEALQTLGTCRGKLKTMCTSDPRRWEQFILGLAALGFLFDFEELVRVAGTVAHDTAPLLDRLAA